MSSSVVWLQNQNLYSVVRLPEPNLITVVSLLSQKLNFVVWLPNSKSCSVINFLIQTTCFEITNSNLSNTTRFTLLDSLLQKVTTREIQIETCLIQQSLFCLVSSYLLLGIFVLIYLAWSITSTILCPCYSFIYKWFIFVILRFILTWWCI